MRQRAGRGRFPLLRCAVGRRGCGRRVDRATTVDATGAAAGASFGAAAQGTVGAASPLSTGEAVTIASTVAAVIDVRVDHTSVVVDATGDGSAASGASAPVLMDDEDGVDDDAV